MAVGEKLASLSKWDAIHLEEIRAGAVHDTIR